MPRKDSDRHQKAESDADCVAKKILAGLRNGQVQRSDILRVLHALFLAKPLQDRFKANPPGKRGVVGGSIGLTYPLGSNGLPALKRRAFCWERTRHVAKLLNLWRDQHMGIKADADDCIRPTSIQLNYNFEGAVHIDGNNLGPSNISAFGKYRNGALLLESDAGTEQRELVCASGPHWRRRTPGVYTFERLQMGDGISEFNGATHLHCAEQCTGERFTAIWYSLPAHWLLKLSTSDAVELRDAGFRPRTGQEEVEAAQAMFRGISALPNDMRKYPDGFLYFSRRRRREVEERGISSKEATTILQEEWQILSKTAAGNGGKIQGTQEYWAGFERLEREPRRKKVAAQKGTRDEAGEDEEEFDAVVVEDSENEAENGPDIEAFANHVLEVFPCALDDTEAGFDLMVEVLEHFGFNDLEQRSRAHSFVKAKRQEARDAAWAAHMEHRSKERSFTKAKRQEAHDAALAAKLQQQDESQPAHVIIDSQASSLNDEAELQQDASQAAHVIIDLQASSSSDEAEVCDVSDDESPAKRIRTSPRPCMTGAVDLEQVVTQNGIDAPASGRTVKIQFGAEMSVTRGHKPFCTCSDCAVESLLAAGFAACRATALQALADANGDPDLAASMLLSRLDAVARHDPGSTKQTVQG